MLKKFLLLPIADYLEVLKVFRKNKGFLTFLIIFLGFVIGWWVYVPLHELLHALGCIVGGGTVSRLDISPLYGATLLKKIFPFIHRGSDYAGQLKGFDTGGNDLTYFLTVFFPYLLTIIFGVPVITFLKKVKHPTLRHTFLFGLAISPAYAPFISITGDLYEMGSILVTVLLPEVLLDHNPTRWRSDDLVRLIGVISESAQGMKPMDLTIITLSFTAGTAIAYSIYLLPRLFFISHTD